MDKLMPIIFQSIDRGIVLSQENQRISQDTINDHRMIMEFMKARNPEGARSAMKIHILRAINDLEID